MNQEQQLLEKWRELSIDKQQKVLEFVESLDKQEKINRNELGKRLRQIRTKIVANGQPLLTKEEIEQEMINRRGGLQEIDE